MWQLSDPMQEVLNRKLEANPTTSTQNLSEELESSNDITCRALQKAPKYAGTHEMFTINSQLIKRKKNRCILFLVVNVQTQLKLGFWILILKLTVSFLRASCDLFYILFLQIYALCCRTQDEQLSSIFYFIVRSIVWHYQFSSAIVNNIEDWKKSLVYYLESYRIY